MWRPRLSDVARLGRRTSPPDPDADLADVMRTDALSNGYNARSLFAQPDIDGGLIGGASLKADDFIAICRAAC